MSSLYCCEARELGAICQVAYVCRFSWIIPVPLLYYTIMQAWGGLGSAGFRRRLAFPLDGAPQSVSPCVWSTGLLRDEQ
jgi:hypothetical protein